MPILDSTKDINYPSLTFQEPEKETVVLFLAAMLDKLIPYMPMPMGESDGKKIFISLLKKLVNHLEKEFGFTVYTRVFKLKTLVPGRVENLLSKEKKKPALAVYDVVVMIACENSQIAEKVQEHAIYQQILNLFGEKDIHAVIAAKNIRKAGETHLRDNFDLGVYLFTYYFLENEQSDFLTVWEHISRWFVEYAKLDNSYMLQAVSGDQYFHYVSHAFWPAIRDFLPTLVVKKSVKTFILDNLTSNNIQSLSAVYKIA